ncbi:Sulfotransferase domain protein [Roseovarius litorisediminis]|uniref:Sulfotransferase domain protein n=1 Tax=Roseovarius litorisediminis TaxID=1312363 RepID=A0A1Y5SEY0_9RHOB|nr:sulfotransferase domain-containing protein [Roseovarius litorisediminis]SLN37585.1 Sulfotransferase domain protein [Roseovarius litorisediminis]
MKKSIVWLASYPKSGNTWVRIFLANYLMNADKPVSINQVNRFGMGDSISKAYRMVGGEDADLTSVHVSVALRPKVLRGIVANNADVNLVKTHNICSSAFGHELIPANVTRSAVYIIRNPLDVIVSYSRHYGVSIPDSVAAFSRSDHAAPAGLNTVHQFLGSWSEHVSSWIEPKKEYPTCILRYEDMLGQPEVAFGKLVKHIGIPLEKERLKRAIKFSSFEELSSQEEKHGFVEGSDKTDRFFVKGQTGQWQEQLTPQLVKRVKKDHRKIMKKFGYLE